MATTRVYVRAVVIAGVIIPVVLHVIASKAMPWWPDTVSMGIAFGVVAVVIVSRNQRQREVNRRLWKALMNLARHRDWS
jgi:peptidoglycan/LPS O-acetylase OafA/YrhL